MGDAGGAFDDHLETDRLGAALGAFDGGDKGVDRIDILGAAHFRDHDLVQTVARLLHQVDHVAVPIGRVQTVDAH